MNWMVKKYTWSTHGVDTVNWMVKKYTWSRHGELDGQEVHMEWTR